MRLRDMIYQGTVWGPWPWNLFYEDARLALHVHSFLDVVFAYDLNAFRSFPLAIPNTELTTESRKWQHDLHAWGHGSQVEFDPKKESVHVASHFCSEGKTFKILGLNFNCRLTMGAAITGLVSEMWWRVHSVLQSRRYQTTVGMMNVFKSKVLSYAEYRTSAIYHACVSSLEAIDRVQGRFLEELGVDKWHAFMVFNLAPLSLRRDIAMLGLIHRAVLGQGPMHFQRFFFREQVVERRSARFGRHPHQLHEYRDGRQLDVVSQSALGLVSVYNLLPSKVVEARSVQRFQSLLQEFVRDCAGRRDDWPQLLSARHPLHTHLLHAY